MMTISPGTTSSEGISIVLPSRLTSALGAESLLSASSAFSAFASCTTPTTAFKRTTIPMITASEDLA
jgi:hypothetical protein